MTATQRHLHLHQYWTTVAVPTSTQTICYRHPSHMHMHKLFPFCPSGTHSFTCIYPSTATLDCSHCSFAAAGPWMRRGPFLIRYEQKPVGRFPPPALLLQVYPFFVSTYIHSALHVHTAEAERPLNKVGESPTPATSGQHGKISCPPWSRNDLDSALRKRYMRVPLVHN